MRNISWEKTNGLLIYVPVILILLLTIIFTEGCGYRRNSDFDVYTSININLRQFDERGSLVYVLHNHSGYTLEYLLYRDMYLDILTDEVWVPVQKREFTDMTALCHYITVSPGEAREIFHESLRNYQVKEAGRYRLRMKVAVEDRSGIRYVRIGSNRRYMHEVIIAEFEVFSVGNDSRGWEIELLD